MQAIPSSATVGVKRKKGLGASILPPNGGKTTRQNARRRVFSMCSVGRYPFLLFASDQYPFDLIEAHLVAPPVVKLRRPGAGMGGLRCGLLQRPAVLKIGRDTGRPETVVADPRLDPGLHGAPANHLVGVGMARELRVNWPVPRPMVRSSGPLGSSASPCLAEGGQLHASGYRSTVNE